MFDNHLQISLAFSVEQVAEERKVAGRDVVRATIDARHIGHEDVDCIRIVL